MEGSLAYEGKINYLRRKNPDFDAKKEKNRFKHLVALAQDKMYAFSLKQDEVENYKEISVLNTGDKMRLHLVIVSELLQQSFQISNKMKNCAAVRQ